MLGSLFCRAAYPAGLCLFVAADGMPIKSKHCTSAALDELEALTRSMRVCRGHSIALDVARALCHMHEVGLHVLAATWLPFFACQLELSPGRCFGGGQEMHLLKLVNLRAPAALQTDILHLDIRHSNVLLARDMTAKVAYGGLGRLMTTPVGRAYTCSSNGASPETLLAMGCSKACDVSSFGKHFPKCSGRAVA